MSYISLRCWLVQVNSTVLPKVQQTKRLTKNKSQGTHSAELKLSKLNNSIKSNPIEQQFGEMEAKRRWSKMNNVVKLGFFKNK